MKIWAAVGGVFIIALFLKVFPAETARAARTSGSQQTCDVTPPDRPVLRSIDAHSATFEWVVGSVRGAKQILRIGNNQDDVLGGCVTGCLVNTDLSATTTTYTYLSDFEPYLGHYWNVVNYQSDSCQKSFQDAPFFQGGLPQFQYLPDPDIGKVDLNGDGNYDIYDLNLFIENYKKTGENIPGDLNNYPLPGDGVVDFVDYGLFRQAWLKIFYQCPPEGCLPT